MPLVGFSRGGALLDGQYSSKPKVKTVTKYVTVTKLSTNYVTKYINLPKYATKYVTVHVKRFVNAPVTKNRIIRVTKYVGRGLNAV